MELLIKKRELKTSENPENLWFLGLFRKEKANDVEWLTNYQ